jgi:hypothetical protein
MDYKERIKTILMMYGLQCDNGKQIDMTTYVLKQMRGEITREELKERIEYYKTTNKCYTL